MCENEWVKIMIKRLIFSISWFLKYKKIELIKSPTKHINYLIQNEVNRKVGGKNEKCK